MSENVAKAQFLNFLLKKKHGSDEYEEHITHSHIKRLKGPEILNEFDADFTEEQLKAWLEKLENSLPVEDAELADLIFCILYSSKTFAKMIKDKSFSFVKTLSLYKTSFEANKKYIMEYNKKEKASININAPVSVVTRFPPEPSGYLHIGHAKAALLNQLMAKKGKLIVRFDDTNPEKECAEYESAIIEDLKMLKITDYTLSRSSNHFDTIYSYAVELIKNGKAYADNTDQQTMRQQRMDGIASKNRDQDPETTLQIFGGMKEGKNRNFCLRAKISTDNPNKAMRDPVIYRFSDMPHHTTGDAWKIYPTYDFTIPIVDSIEGVTLSLRTSEYRDRNAQFYWFIDALRLANCPKIHDFARMNFDNTVISKRKMKFYVENKYVDGWDDPRMCTLRGLKNLGMHMDALIEYVYLQGASQKISVNSWDKIWAINKRIIDPLSPRYSAICSQDAVVCTFEDLAEGFQEIRNIPKNKKNNELGDKSVVFSQSILISQEDASALQDGEEFTLMHWGNAVLRSKTCDSTGVVRQMSLTLNMDGDYKKTKHKISWISEQGATSIMCYEYGNLQIENAGDDLAAAYNKDSKKKTKYIAEFAITDVGVEEFIQIERIGFFYSPKKFVYNLVPYTKQKRLF
ncbi:glutamyl-tRNA synthetase [Enteropsectra breve]|nr:glutamyl-tRNA synthetase [Enteropsectra breve]